MKTLITLVLLLQYICLHSQTTHCGTDSVARARSGNDPQLIRQAFLHPANQGARTPAVTSRSIPAYTIPVVVHILYSGGADNVTDSQVQQALGNLHKDFNRLNADTSLVVPEFKNLIGDAQIHFQLAAIDPNGHCTNGIIRYFTTDAWTGSFLDFKYTWPPDRYMNIYVVNKFSNPWISSYASMPSVPVPPMEDVIVIQRAFFLSQDFLTHEVGHWLDLQHPSGMGQPVNCGDDGITDTPPTKGFNTCDLTNAAVCNPTVTENVQNFMDFSCRHMFTPGQVQHMHATLASTVAWRSSLSTYYNHLQTGITSSAPFCLPKLDIFPYDTVFQCVGSTIQVDSYTSNIAPISYSWTADNGASVTNPNAPTAIVAINSTGFTHIVCSAANSNGATTRTLVVYAPNYPVFQPNITESFESVNLPSGWTTSGDGSVNWQIYPGAASHASMSAYVQGEALATGKQTWLETPSYDLASDPNAKFTFWYAYARQSSTHKDVFRVTASTDCGQTWTDIWEPSAAQAAAGSGETTTTPLVPQAGQWKFYDLGAHPKFTPLRSFDNVRFRFVFTQDPVALNGNRFFLDEINLFSTVAMAELSGQSKPTIYPSPNNGQFNVRFPVSQAGPVRYSIQTIDGRTCSSGELGEFAQGIHKTTIDAQDLPEGVYLFRIETSTGRSTTKMAIIK